MTAGERIMQLRLDRGYTRGQLAYMAEISEKFLYEIEMNKKGFSAVTLLRISNVLEVSMDYIMSGCESKNQEEKIVSILERFRPDTLIMVEQLLDVIYEMTK